MKTMDLKSNSTLIKLAFTGIVLTIGVASQVGAEVKTKNVALNVAGALATELPAKKTEVREVSNLRCWQDGKLLFEETNLNERALASSKQVMVFDTASSGDQGEVFLIETGSATCLYKKYREFKVVSVKNAPANH